MKWTAHLLLLLPLTALAGGSNYGIVPGAHPKLAGTVREWPVPTPKFARDPADRFDHLEAFSAAFLSSIALFPTSTVRWPHAS